MRYSVIYSVDVPADCDPLDYAPPHVNKLWDQTEGDSQYELSYLEGRWKTGRHRKWCAAMLSQKQFDEFVEHCGLVADPTETLGSIGAPGFGFGWSPAISFSNDSPDALQNAYVTPIPESKKRGTEHDWRQVKDQVLAAYG